MLHAIFSQKEHLQTASLSKDQQGEPRTSNLSFSKVKQSDNFEWRLVNIC